MVIAVLVIIIFLQRACSPVNPTPPTPPKPEIITIIDTQYITKEVKKPVYVPGEVEFLPGDTLYEEVDTAAILKDFYATRIYKDTVQIDSVGYAYITDSITQNKIKSREFKATYTLPVVTKTTTITLPPTPRTQLYVGAEAVGNAGYPIHYFGATTVLKTKQDAMYTLGAGYTLGQRGVSIKAGMLWKLKVK